MGLARKAILLSNASPALAILTLFEFIFLTPLGLFSAYLLISGGVRAVAVAVDDPRGDPILSALHWAVTTTARKNQQDRARIAGEIRGSI